MNIEADPGSAVLRTLTGVADHRRAGQPALPRAEWPDEALMAALQEHDDAAFSVLYQRYADLVYSTSLRVLSDPQLAEDATQDIFTRLWKQPGSFVPERGRFIGWLMSMTRNRCVDELRARGRRLRREVGSTPEQDDAVAAIPANENDEPGHRAQLGEEQRAVRAALATIPAEQRRTLELAYFGGLTQAEIANRLGEPLGTVKTRIRLGMQKLRLALEDRV